MNEQPVASNPADGARSESRGRKRRRRDTECAGDARPGREDGHGEEKKERRRSSWWGRRKEKKRKVDQAEAAPREVASVVAPLSTWHRPRPLVHCSKSPRFSSRLAVTVLGGGTLEVTTTNAAEVVDLWLAQHSREDSRVWELGLAGVGQKTRGADAATCPAAAFCGSVAMPGGEVCVLGLDVEWRPNYNRGPRNPVALLQLSTARHCLLVQMLFLDRTPPGLRCLLGAKDIFFGGVGVQEDAAKLAEDHGLECRAKGLLELKALAQGLTWPGGVAPASLKHFCASVLGEELDKQKRITMSNWAAHRLTDEQVRYAALDAWASHRVAVELMSQAQEQPAKCAAAETIS